MSDLSNRLKHIRKAIYANPLPTDELSAKISEMEDKLRAIQTAMFGDGVASTLDQDTPFSISGRMGWLAYEMWNSTSAPTQTQRDALKIAGEEFKPQQAALNKLVEVELKLLEERLEAAGTPYTPGRRIGLGDQ